LSDRIQRGAPWWIVAAIACLAMLGVDALTLGERLEMLAAVLCLIAVCIARFEHALLFLVALSTIHGDVALLAAQLALLVRLVLRGELALDKSFASLLLCAVAVSTAGSALFGFFTMQQRPLQWLIWLTTMGFPLAMLGMARARIPDAASARLWRFLLFCLGVQIPIGIVDLYRHGEATPGDWFAGTWQDANVLGLWAACALSVAFIRLVVLPRHVEHVPGRAQTIAGMAALGFLMAFASARIFAGSMICGAGFVIAALWLAGGDVSRRSLALRAIALIAAGAAATLLAHSWIEENADAFASNWQESGKHALFERIFGEFGGRYNAVLGVGPGMAGSRAASAASADVLFKEVTGIASSLLGPAPEPERWAMRDLWTAELAASIATKSALITMPFSGWASARAELGWPAVLALLLFLLALAVRLARVAVRHPPVFGIAAAAAVLCAGLPIMLTFDNVLEQPHITAPLIVLAMVSRGYRMHGAAA